ncbi:MAG: hypothetical protein LBD35_01630 [Prevotellaceae bacterium]|nr:hypothetical protein [Prevotellaceae bacterium]
MTVRPQGALQPSICPFVHSSIRPRPAVSLDSCTLPPAGRSLKVADQARKTRNLFHLPNAPRLSALFLRQYHFAICFS